jgi:hypothetical protein
MFYASGHWPSRGVLFQHGLGIPDTESWIRPNFTSCTKEPSGINNAAMYIVTVGHKVFLDICLLIQNNTDTSTVVCQLALTVVVKIIAHIVAPDSVDVVKLK